ncbi:MAG: nitroreductase family protein [Desulfobulbus sp.]|jgi:nitroreductase
MLEKLVLASRSYRRFDEHRAIPLAELEALVALARICPSAGNRQPLRFALSVDPADNARIFACLKWAGYLTDWDGPKEGERPAGYIVILNTAPEWGFATYDIGIMAQTMMLGAVEKGLGGCMIGAFDRTRLAAVLGLEAGLEIALVLALGKPVEEVRIVDVAEDGSIKYYRDAAGVHYVPKQRLETLIVRRG